jgi:SAM-dependent methyltransferase
MNLSCRSCAGEELSLFLSLGHLPLANAFLAPGELDEPEPRYPLDLAFCHRCALVQITETIPPGDLFSEYLYFSSFSDFMVEHARALARTLIDARHLGGKSLVVEVASNDGYLLQHFARENVPVLGIEPASNVARFAREKHGIPTLCEFFSEEVARRLRSEGRRADVLIANNVLAHAADLNGFVEGFRILLADDGIAVFEVPYVRDLIEGVAFDTIYHEHLCYFSLTSLQKLFARHDMHLDHVERVPVHGGSLRLFVSAGGGSPSEAVRGLNREEAQAGVDAPRYYVDFGREVEGLKKTLVSLLASIRARGQHIAAYGAAAKGTVLLNYCGIGGEILDFVVDRSPHKQGRYVPGVRLPILPPDRLLEAMPEYTLLLPWNIAEEIMEQQSEYRRRGGQFIIPVPTPRVAA